MLYERDYIYHYTNLDTLALILQNRTFRLSPLLNMDDKQECMTQEKFNLGKYIYVSCWTKMKAESIPMWAMYTSETSGVRIKMRTGFFKWYDVNKEQVCRLDPRIKVSGEKSDLKMLFPIEKFYTQPYYCTPYKANELLMQVIYTSDNNLLKPKIITETEGELSIAFGNLGIYKNKAWEFQEEWRFKMILMPFSVEEALNNPTQITNEIIKSIVLESYKMPAFIDLEIDDKAMKEMEITISPFMTDGNRRIVNDLIEKYCNSATIKMSELDGLV